MNRPNGYVVVLNPATLVGEMYLRGNNDGTLRETPTGVVCPYIVCTSIEMDSPFGIRAIRPLKTEGKSRQVLYLPYGSVVVMYEVGGETKAPFGFAPTTDD